PLSLRRPGGLTLFGLTLLHGPGFSLSFQNSARSLGQLTSLSRYLLGFLECFTRLFVFGSRKPDSLSGLFGLVMRFGRSQNKLAGFSFASALPGIIAFHDRLSFCGSKLSSDPVILTSL